MIPVLGIRIFNGISFPPAPDNRRIGKVIEVKNVSKHYGENIALSNINFSVGENTVVGFLGPNGAGKSTTMNIITGYISASGGSVKVGKYDTLDDPVEAKKLIGYMPEVPPLYQDMTVDEYLNFVYELKKVTLPKKKHLNEICAVTKTAEVRKRLIGHLSKGYRQRVGFAQALVGNPPVLILDEPTSGLDPKQIKDMRGLIKELGKNHTVILSSHILPEVQAVCDRIIIVSNGKIVADGTPFELENGSTGTHTLTVRIEGEPGEVEKSVKAIKGVRALRNFGEKEPGVYEYEIGQDSGEDIRRALFSVASKRDWPILSMSNGAMSLEDVFIKLTSPSYVRDKELLQSAMKGGE